MASFNKLASGRWQARVKRGGQAMAKSFSDKRAAERWARDTESRLEQGVGKQALRNDWRTLGDLIDHYLADAGKPTTKSRVNESNRMLALKASVGHLLLASLQPHDLVRFIEMRLQDVSAQTAKHDINSLSVVLDRARLVWGAPLAGNAAADARKILAANGAFSGIKARSRRPSEAELAAIYADLNPQMACIAEFAVETCMRRGEIVAMRWEDIDFGQRLLHIPITKNGEARTIKLSSRAVELLEAQGKQRAGRVFPVAADSVSQAFARSCERTAVASLRFHDLRHEGISRLFEQGLSIPQVSVMSGHKTWSQLRRYTQLSAADLPIA